jgi:hypothetical protein
LQLTQASENETISPDCEDTLERYARVPEPGSLYDQMILLDGLDAPKRIAAKA